tara:strand:- start:77512 stop:77706 length:195 start_codon:yes stop_codon:yes gene_type:complete
MPQLPVFDPELIDLLIKKEIEEQNSVYDRPFIQLPTPNKPHCPQYSDQHEEKDFNTPEVIEIDI